jgi:flagellar M-ring protein FliF
MAVDANALKTRAQDTLKKFTGPQLVIIALLTVFGVVAGGMFLRWISTPTYQVLIAGMSSEDAAAVTEKLQGDGVPYKLADSGSTVMVPAAQVDAERIAIAAAGLPKGATKGSYEAFDKLGFGASSFQQQVARQRAFESDLSATVGSIDGVNSATVHLALPEQSLFAKERKPARASVVVDTDGDMTDENVEAITHLVASSVPDLEPGDVTVTDTKGRLLSGDGGLGGTTAGGTSKALALQRSYEDVMTASATSLLEQILGPGRALVRVNAEIDTSQKTLESEQYDPQGSVISTEQKSGEKLVNGGPQTGPGGILTIPPVAATPGANGSYDKSDEARTYNNSKTVTRQQFSPGTVKRLTVAVAVDRNVTTAPPAAEIESLVANAVGLNVQRGDAISITRAVFPKPEAINDTTSKKPDGLMTQVPSLATTGVAIVLLLLVGLGFLKAVRRVQVDEIDLTDAALALPAGAQAALPAADGAQIAIPAPREQQEETQILKMIEDQPDEVASLLRGWLSDGAVKS